MKGLIIWADSYCRSTLAFFKGLGASFNTPLRLVIFKNSCDKRLEVGFSTNEFSDLNITYFNDIENIEAFVCQYKDFHHIFGVYQKDNGCRDILHRLKTLGATVGVVSEAPCNMDSGCRRWLKYAYMLTALPYKVRQVPSEADFILNLSGENDFWLKKLGWKPRQIVHCGYYPPPIIGSKCVLRNQNNWKQFNILLTGVHTPHRSPMTLLRALRILDRKGIPYTCNITQNGPLIEKMKAYALRHNLHNVHFLGFVPMETLIHLYETCSVYVGAGSDEPWGMRLNDALNCGAPLVVSEGMGGYRLVNDYKCGLTFPRNDYKALAKCLSDLIFNETLYLNIAQQAYDAKDKIDPFRQASEISSVIKSQYPSWNV